LSKTSPPATATSVPTPVRVSDQATVSAETFDGDSTFSVASSDWWSGVSPACGQSVRTRKETVAVRPDVWPTTWIVCEPGRAPVGTVIGRCLNPPLVLAAPLASAVPSKTPSTVSPAPNRFPVTVTLLPGGPTVGVAVTRGLVPVIASPTAVCARMDAGTSTVRRTTVAPTTRMFIPDIVPLPQIALP